MLLPARTPPPSPNLCIGSAAATWALLLALVRLRRQHGFPARDAGFRLLEDGTLAETPDVDPRIAARWQPQSGWSVPGDVDDVARAMLDLYLPVCNARPGWPLVVAHLGQSIDARIATASGDSCFVTGEANRRHLHRLRALCDAVVVGVGTIATDDPMLTTRLVPGENPVRVVLDPSFRIPPAAAVLSDRRAPTIVAVDAARVRHAERRAGAAEVVGAPRLGGNLDFRALRSALGARGLHALFVEGGGVTVSRFLEAGQIDLLQITIAPVIIGAGRPGLQRPAVPSMRECPRPAGQVFRMGEDVLWSFDYRTPPGGTPPADANDLQRIR